MFQSFVESSSPVQGPKRLSDLREVMSEAGLTGFIVPRADAHQGEYVAPRDDRLAWLTGFTGSAGWCVALSDRAAVFTDSRYTVQVKDQTADVFEKVDWPAVSLGDWISGAAPEGLIGFDPWLLSVDQLRAMEKKIGARLQRCANLVDQIWIDQPAPPLGKVAAHPLEFAGEPHAEKMARLAAGLKADAAVITLPDSIAWLLNIRGMDIQRNPVPHSFAILHRDGHVDMFIAPEKLTDLGDHLGPNVRTAPPSTLLPVIEALTGSVQIDPASCPVAIVDAIKGTCVEAADPCVLPKARKNAAELSGSRAAHIRDAAAMVRFLAWLDDQAQGSLTEIDVATRLEAERRKDNALRDISFDTISAAGPNAALPHYRVSEDSNRTIEPNSILLVDSGGQYLDGTTDITRTIAIGELGEEECRANTLVLKGMIALSKLRFPKGLAGRDIDPLARMALWEHGLDFGHGTGHGVGAYLCVHEGPARIARTGHVPLEPGMILSNEPGFYKEGHYGIRIENLIVVQEAPALPGQSVAEMYQFETITWVPIDTRLINTDLLTAAERDWLNAYHAETYARVAPHVEGAARDWLSRACQAL
ncbi:MAG: aminopeptidase P family protein [Pelagimonas sp.]